MEKKRMKFYTGNIYPAPNTIFVFGSNPEGRHGAGSARVAVQQFGAKYGQGEGLQGQSYALPTTDLRVSYRPSINEPTIVNNIVRLYKCAEENSTKDFMIAYRSKSEKTLCGYSGYDLIRMFKKAGELYGRIPDNIVISNEWMSIW